METLESTNERGIETSADWDLILSGQLGIHQQYEDANHVIWTRKK